MRTRVTWVLITGAIAVAAMAVPFQASANAARPAAAPDTLRGCLEEADRDGIVFSARGAGKAKAGECVRVIQAFLNDALPIARLFGSDVGTWQPIAEDGKYGPATSTAVANWKRVNERRRVRGWSVTLPELRAMTDGCETLVEVNAAAFANHLRTC